MGVNGTMLVLIADHHAIVRTGLACFVEQLDANVEVLQSQSHGEAIDQLSQRKVDLAVVGVFQTNGGLAPQIRELADAAQPAPLIVFAEPSSRELIESCIHAGANAFVAKSTDERHLIHILRLVLEGGSYIPAETVKQIDSTSRPARDSAKIMIPPARLTNRQADVLNCLRLGMSNSDIADKLGLNLSTVKGHVSAVLKTLGVRNRTQAVIAARKTAP